MAPKIFTPDSREQFRRQMLDAGIPLLREYGMTHMSVERITAAAGIGKTTFYNFFPSKEAYVMEVIEDNRRKFQDWITAKLAGRDRMTQTEGEELLRQIIFSPNSAYQYLSQEDQFRLRRAVPSAPDLDEETAILSELFSKIENVRTAPDYAVIANLLKIMALAAEARDELHESAYTRTQEHIYGLMFSLIFEDSGDAEAQP